MFVRVVDCHSSGAPVRVVVGGLEGFEIPGAAMMEKSRFMEHHLDWLRTALIWEPRGHPALNVDYLLPTCDPRADVGVVICEQSLYTPMSGGNVICVVTALFEGGVLPMTPPASHVVLDTPAGLVRCRAACSDGRVREVAFTNVPAFAFCLDAELDVPAIGRLRADLAYGGMTFAIVEAASCGLDLDRRNATELARVGELVRRAANEQVGEIVHPEDPSIRGIMQTLWTGPPRSAANHGRNAVVMPGTGGGRKADGGPNALVDRSPCGTGTSARLAVLSAKGQIAVGEDFRHESLIDGVYVGRVLRTTTVGEFAGVVPEIRGSAWVTSRAEIVLAEDDPLRSGFTIADVWPVEAWRPEQEETGAVSGC